MHCLYYPWCQIQLLYSRRLFVHWSAMVLQMMMSRQPWLIAMTYLTAKSSAFSCVMERRRIMTKLGTCQDVPTCCRPATSMLLFNTSQIRTVLTLPISSTNISPKWMSSQSSEHFESKVFILITKSQSHSSQIRTYTCGNYGWRDTWIGLSQIGWQLPSQMSWFFTCLDQME